ncbi:Na+/H+ antiporter subunit D [Desulforamulus aeronauticus]|uniref:Multicomponent Na+:H+ antiporter subunit D n=1 Tax=Desulforamulus aeronauticus DSM 10349 TaxID=1121421 RepID=A0A1M6NPE2_9FIRM|nr:Na+/H+ antiporter subunit D [Desulforamulus aeronauticus]SHJ97565.1 multicomponent Na+:H+ antiporter subunit D [Desulforamulus aeronauticus DSM 10349]
MNNLVILPLLIPLLAGIFLVIFRQNILLQRWFSIVAIFSTGVVAAYLLQMVADDGIQTLAIGGWEAPFGIVLVIDMFSGLLILTTSIVSFGCILFAFNSIGLEREQFYFYPFMLFLITGVNGSFLTGDLFNLFVCFEVMLISSYVLISLGGTKVQLRESIKYVLINIMSSTMFLLGIAYLYAITGTLNMAHLSVRIAEVGQQGLLTTVAILFLVVFSLKAALFLYFWLPGSYAAPPTAIGAIFGALLTKVGIYALFRMFTLVFYHQPEITHLLLGVMAALTMLLGGIGAVSQWDIRKIIAYNVIIAVGFIVSGLAVFTSTAVAGGIYYLIHDMIVKALLFLLGGTIIGIAGTSKLKEMSGLIRNHPLLGWMFFITVLALAGIPPLSGFIGKVLVIKGTMEAEFYWLAVIGLLSSLMVLYSVMKIFVNGFWGETYLSKEQEKGTTSGLLFPCILLTMVSIGFGLGVEGITFYIDQAANGLMNPDIYIKAVLKSP